MESQKFEWLRKDVEKLDEKIDMLQHSVDQDFVALEKKIDELLSFKWKIVGGSVVLSTILGVVIHIATLLIEYKK